MSEASARGPGSGCMGSRDAAGSQCALPYPPQNTHLRHRDRLHPRNGVYFTLYVRSETSGGVMLPADQDEPQAETTMEWWLSFFGEEYIRLYHPFLSAERTAGEVAGLLDLLDRPSGCAL